jgi:hypothetical protein
MVGSVELSPLGGRQIEPLATCVTSFPYRSLRRRTPREPELANGQTARCKGQCVAARLSTLTSHSCYNNGEAIRYTKDAVNELGTPNVSAAIFGNSHMAVILTDLSQRADSDWPVTTRQVASATGLADSLVRAVLLRLVAAGALNPLPKTEGLRGRQFFDKAGLAWWQTLVDLAGNVVSATPPTRPNEVFSATFR